MIAPILVLVGALIGVVVLWRNRLKLASILVLAGSLLFLAITVPSMKPAKFEAYRQACIFNLQAIADAKAEWVRRFPGDVDQSLSAAQLAWPNGSLRHFPTCPFGGVYEIGHAGDLPTCSFSQMGHVLTPEIHSGD
jgi:hypothetical protein